MVGKKRPRESNMSNIPNNRNKKRARPNKPLPNQSGFENTNIPPTEIPPGAPMKAPYRANTPPTSRPLPNDSGFENTAPKSSNSPPNAPKKRTVYNNITHTTNNNRTRREVIEFFPLAPVVPGNNDLANLPNNYSMIRLPSQMIKTFNTQILPRLAGKTKNEINAIYRKFVAARTLKRKRASYKNALNHATQKNRNRAANNFAIKAQLEAKIASAVRNINDDETVIRKYAIPRDFERLPLISRERYFKNISNELFKAHGDTYTIELISSVYALLQLYKDYLTAPFYFEVIRKLSDNLPISAGTRKYRRTRKN